MAKTYFGVLLACTLLAGAETKIKRVPAKPATSIEGKQLFQQYCAVCHGTDAKGNGPAVTALAVKPGDLTTVSQRNGGTFPEVRVLRAISGEAGLPAHGSREMPVWGPIFRNMASNADVGSVRIYNLVKYIETLQKK
jgi:mono/diheme cytochrome c family protein